MFPVWDFVVGISARKAMLIMGWMLSTLLCQYLYNKKLKRIKIIYMLHRYKNIFEGYIIKFRGRGILETSLILKPLTSFL